jgi:hypothetical protein
MVAETNTDLECCALDGAPRAAARDEHAPWSRALWAPAATGIVRRVPRCASGTADVACHPREPPPTGAGEVASAKARLPSPASTQEGRTNRDIFHRSKRAWRLPPKREPPARF